MSETSRHLLITLIAVLIGSGAMSVLAAAELPHVNAEDAGFSNERLARLDLRIREGVAKSEIPGAIVVIARGGRIVYEREYGFLDSAKKIPMRKDAVFRLASMTKPVTSAAVMMLVEEGKIRLTDPASLYLPELKKIKGVAVEVVDPTTKSHTMRLDPLQRDILIVDLLRHTSGFSNGGEIVGATDSSLVGKAYREAGVSSRDITSAEQVTRLATVPLASQPGTAFEYGVSTDVLGRVVEVVSGMPLDQFIKDRIATPLGIETFDFYVNEINRFARPMAVDEPRPNDPTQKPKRAAGAGGMFASARDYMRFAQMIANGGSLDGVRLLAPKTVALMSHNHLSPSTIHAKSNPPMSLIAPTREMGQGFGLGFAVRLGEGGNPAAGSVGDYYWAGASGVYFWIDPVEDLVVVFMAAAPQLETKTAYRGMIRNLVYQAMVGEFKPRTDGGDSKTGSARTGDK